MNKTTSPHIISAITVSRNAVYKILANLDRKILNRTNPVFILSYHSISKDNWRFSIDPVQIKKQILYLKKNFEIITLGLLHDYLEGKVQITKPSVVLTFDDGYKDILQLRNFFKLHQIKPSIFVLSDTKHPNWKELGSKRPFLHKRDILALAKSGWEIGCHSATHANLSTLSDQVLREEIVNSKINLEKSLGMSIKYFAYPRGKYSNKVLSQIKKAKYTMALTMDDGIIQPSSNLHLLPRIGIDRTHSFEEFTCTYSPSVVQFRQLIKSTPIRRFL